jgi:hypothetical protein
MARRNVAMNDLRDDEPVEVSFVAKALRQTVEGRPIDGWESFAVTQDDVDRAREILRTVDGIRQYWSTRPLNNEGDPR